MVPLPQGTGNPGPGHVASAHRGHGVPQYGKAKRRFFAAAWGGSRLLRLSLRPMTVQTHQQLASFIWSICNLLRGPYKRNEYSKVILPLAVLRRFDGILAPTKATVLEKYEKIKKNSDKIVQGQLCEITGRDFYNISKLDFPRLPMVISALGGSHAG
jgi:hypothetical protein